MILQWTITIKSLHSLFPFLPSTVISHSLCLSSPHLLCSLLLVFHCLPLLSTSHCFNSHTNKLPLTRRHSPSNCVSLSLYPHHPLLCDPLLQLTMTDFLSVSSLHLVLFQHLSPPPFTLLREPQL